MLKNNMSWEDKGTWLIDNNSSAEKFAGRLINSQLRPVVVTITGSKLQGQRLIQCIKNVSTVRCDVHLILHDAFEKSTAATNQWLSILISGATK